MDVIYAFHLVGEMREKTLSLLSTLEEGEEENVKRVKAVFGENGQIRPWIFHAFEAFITSMFHVQNERRNPSVIASQVDVKFGEDGRISPWLLQAFESFISCIFQPPREGPLQVSVAKNVTQKTAHGEERGILTEENFQANKASHEREMAQKPLESADFTKDGVRKDEFIKLIQQATNKEAGKVEQAEDKCSAAMEEMSSYKDFPGDVCNKSSAQASAMDAVIKSYKTLSQIRMEEEVRMKLLGKLFEAIGDHCESEKLHLSSENVVTSPAKENVALSTFHEEKKQLNVSSFVDEDGQTENTKRKERERSSVMGKEPFYPLDKDPSDNVLCPVPHVFSVPTKGLSFVPDNQGSMGLHVPHCMAGEKVKYMPNTQPQVSTKSSFTEIAISKDVGPFLGNSGNVMCMGDVHGTCITLGSENHSHSSEPMPFNPHFNPPESIPTNPSDFIASNRPEFPSPNRPEFPPPNRPETSLSDPILHPPPKPSVEKEKTHLSFSQVLQQNTTFPPSSISPSLEVVGFDNTREKSPLIKIDQETLNRRLSMCKFSIIGKISLAKGEEPWAIKKLRVKLEEIWKLNSAWRLIGLGKGFFQIVLLSKEEWDKVWARGFIHLKPGTLRLQRWSIDFDPLKEKTTNAQVWLRIFQLPWGLWDPQVISGIASKVGVPLRIDNATLNGDFGHYARVLVDMDLSKEPISAVLVECGNHTLEVSVIPENLPSFCENCLVVGHCSKDCRKLLSKREMTKHPKGKREGEPELQIAESLDPIVIENGPLPIDSSFKKARKEVDCIDSFFGSSFVEPLVVHRFIDDMVAKEVFNVGGKEKHANHVPVIQENGKGESCQGMSEMIMEPRRNDHLVESPNRFSALRGNLDDDDIGSSSPSLPISDQRGDKSPNEDVIRIPKLPKRWSDIMDEEEDKQKFYSLDEANATIMKTRAAFDCSYQDISDFRARLKDVWVDRDDSRFERDMPAVLDPPKYVDPAAKPFFAHIPKKDKKIKIGPRQPKG